jgi:hypothetical protein
MILKKKQIQTTVYCFISAMDLSICSPQNKKGKKTKGNLERYSHLVQITLAIGQIFVLRVEFVSFSP